MVGKNCKELWGEVRGFRDRVDREMAEMFEMEEGGGRERGTAWVEEKVGRYKIVMESLEVVRREIEEFLLMAKLEKAIVGLIEKGVDLGKITDIIKQYRGAVEVLKAVGEKEIVSKKDLVKRILKMDIEALREVMKFKKPLLVMVPRIGAAEFHDKIKKSGVLECSRISFAGLENFERNDRVRVVIVEGDVRAKLFDDLSWEEKKWYETATGDTPTSKLSNYFCKKEVGEGLCDIYTFLAMMYGSGIKIDRAKKAGDERYFEHYINFHDSSVIGEDYLNEDGKKVLRGSMMAGWINGNERLEIYTRGSVIEISGIRMQVEVR